MFTWKTFVWSTVAGLSLLAGLPGDADACCGWGSGYRSYYAGYYPAYYGGYYTGYTGYYGAGYYGAGYYGGYAPYYGGCSGCSSCGSCYGGCSSCGPSCSYACAGPGCSSCAGGGCAVTAPTGDSTRPTPDDGFRGGAGGNPADNAPADLPPRRRTYSDPPSTPPGGSARPNPGSSRNDEVDSTRSRSRSAPEASPATENEPFDAPLRPRRGGIGEDRIDGSSKKEPMPKTNSDIDPDAFDPEEDETTPAKTETKRPNLGAPGTVIPQKQPAPTELPPEDEAPKPEQPEASKADEAATTTAVAPKTRLVLSTRFATPKIVRLKLRPNQDWIATPAEPVLAKHDKSR